ncbi:hypothetical protein Tco_1066815 [Tanacetum coccineum]|uniref:Uncharacterized protein n=1 Tax=Tanacetum coccineum TaxID=301880 RepID=A0ABQ5HB23_9ASTR
MAQPQRPDDVHQDELCPPNKKHTLHEDGSKYTLKFMLNRKELTLTLEDFRIIFYLPQATDHNHDCFVPDLKFSEMDSLQVSLVEQKSQEDNEARENVEKVKQHLMAEEIKKLDPRSDKESTEVEITIVVTPVIINEEEEETADDGYELRQREKGNQVEDIRNAPSPTDSF